MHELIVPTEVKISELSKNGSLSPNNYKKLTIKNRKQHTISFYLDDESPYQKGIEPGSGAYVPWSSQKFLRNSCINNIQFSADKSKYTQTSHIENGKRSLKNQYFSSQNSFQAAL